VPGHVFHFRNHCIQFGLNFVFGAYSKRCGANVVLDYIVSLKSLCLTKHHAMKTY
jgi:hypothetical protein